MKQKFNSQYWNSKTTNLIVGLLGIILILISIIFGIEKIFCVVMISVGTSILASSVVSFISSRYLINDNELNTLMVYWGIGGIYQTRAKINDETNMLLKNAKKLDVCAMGLKQFRDSQGQVIIKRISEGMKLRIITLAPDSKYLSIIDETEDVGIGSTKATIESLLSWVKDLQGAQLFDGQVEIKTYDHYPYEFYFGVDETVFTGPYQNKTSQQTITYKYTSKGNGSKYYRQYFDSLWSQSNG